MSTLTVSPVVHSTHLERELRASSPRPARAATRRPIYRLTRRGRVVVLGLGLLALLAAMVLVASGSMASSDRGGDVATETVLVQPGDTLWGIASAAGDGGDVRDTMIRIERLNGLESGRVVAGDELFVPVG